MSDALSREQYAKDYIERADESFATHVVKDGARHNYWTIERADGFGFHRTDILWLPRGFFLLHGDIEGILIWTDRGTLQDRLDFIGHSHADYIAEKAGKAFKMPNVGMCFDDRVAQHDLIQKISDIEGTEPGDSRAPNSWLRALGRMEEYGASAMDAMRQVWEETGDHEFSIGEVVDGRIYYAQAAARRLLALLKEAKAEATAKEQ